MLETEAGVITETIAICKYLARVGPESAEGLMGSTPLEAARVEQMLAFGLSQIKPNISVIAHATFGILTPF